MDQFKDSLRLHCYNVKMTHHKRKWNVKECTHTLYSKNQTYKILAKKSPNEDPNGAHLGIEINNL